MWPAVSVTPDQASPHSPTSVKIATATHNDTAEFPTAPPINPAAVSDRRAEPRMVDAQPGKSDSAALVVGRRAAPRLRVSLPAQLIAVEKVHTCILLNLSRTGAQVAILDSIREGEGAILRCDVINQFTLVTRCEFGLNALEFEDPLFDEVVLEIRRYYENFEERERRALIETACKWVNGDFADDRPM
jgi:hypothetical protein